MALGKTQLLKVDEYSKTMNDEIKKMQNSWNTFQYVVKSLDEWANETTIGNEMKASLLKMTNLVQELNEDLVKMQKSIDYFASRQNRINNV